MNSRSHLPSSTARVAVLAARTTSVASCLATLGAWCITQSGTTYLYLRMAGVEFLATCGLIGTAISILFCLIVHYREPARERELWTAYAAIVMTMTLILSLPPSP